MTRRRFPKTAVASLFDASTNPVYVLNDAQQIAFCNQALAEWTGVAAEELIGRPVEYHSAHDPGTTPGVAAGLCPPPEVFDGRVTQGHVSCQSRDGRLVFRRGRFVPLVAGSASSGETSPLVAVVCVLAAEDRSSEEVASQLSPDTDRDTLHAEIRRFRRAQAEQYDPARLVGASPAMQTVRRQIALAAEAPVPVTIVGPPRSGRDHVARAIHYHPPTDVARKLIPLDANSLGVEELKWAVKALERESRPGRPGTLLVREIDQASTDVQRELRAVVTLRQPGVRVLVTSTEDPRSLVDRQVTGDSADEADEPFDRSLAIALATLIICLPPLHARPMDLPLLAQLFVEERNRTTGRQIGGLQRGAAELLATYSWPGGIDELRDVIQTAHAAAAGTEITPADLPPIIHHAAAAAEIPENSPQPIDLEAYLVRIERDLIERALRIADGNKTRAAELVGMTRPRFYRRLEQLER